MSDSKPMVGVVMGSDSDWPLVQKGCATLESFGVPYETRVISAHRTPEEAIAYSKGAEARGIKVIIACAGGAAHLAGVLAAGTVLPVVGGMMSDASGAVLAAAGVIRSCAGAFGLITVCILCAGPFAVLSVKMLILKAAAAVTDSMQSPRLSALFSGVGSAMGLLLGLLGCCGIMLFISMLAGMKAVTG